MLQLRVKMFMKQEILITPTWALHRRLYDWVLSFAHSKYAATALFVMSFSESSFFPIAPDVLQIPLTISRPQRAWYFATISSIASVLGGILGYFIGALLWQLFSPFFLTYVFELTTFNQVSELYKQWDAWIIFIAAFTPLPYKVFTIAAGVCQISLPVFILASLIGRSARFFLVAALLWRWGDSVKSFIEKYFNLLSVAFILLLIGAFLILRILK